MNGRSTLAPGTRPAPAALPLLAGALLALVLGLPATSLAQPLPVTRLAYSAKYIYGTGNPFSPIPAGDLTTTVVELHNAHSSALVCSVKVVQDHPFQQVITPQYAVTVEANGTLMLDASTFGLAVFRMGFVEIIAPRQVKVVAVYREMAEGRNGSVAIGKKSCPWVLQTGIIRHSATAMFGQTISPEGDILRNDTVVSIANLSNAATNVNIKIVSSTGPIHSIIKLLGPNGFATIGLPDIPPATPFPFIGGVTVEYPDIGIGGYMEVEEILKEYVGGYSPSVSLSVVEVQPVTLR